MDRVRVRVRVRVKVRVGVFDDGPRAHGGLVVCEEAHVRGGHEEVPCALGVDFP